MEFTIARQWAEEYFKRLGTSVGSTVDDGEYYVFGPATKIECSYLFAVSKFNDSKVDYFPPDHARAFKSAKRVKTSR